MIKKITKWETDGGKVFDTRKEAEKYVLEQETGSTPLAWSGEINTSDFKVSIFRSGNCGWYHQPGSCVRVTHLPTGFYEEEISSKSVYENNALARERLLERLKLVKSYKDLC